MAARLRRGEDLPAVRGSLGDPPAVEIPASLLPSAKLRDFIGSAASSVAQALPVGGVSDPERGPDGYRVLVVLERDDATGFDDHRAEVLAEFRRRAGENALRGYLLRLRREADVVIAGDPK